MQTIGHMLKKARESKPLTIDQVSKKTHINSEVLTALEEGRCDQMLSYTYVKSFLKQYCGFLGLDPVEMLKEYSTARQEKISDHPMQLRPAEIKKPAAMVSRQEVEAARKEQAPINTEAVVKLAYIATSVILAVILLFSIIYVTKKVAGAFRKKGKIAYKIQQKPVSKPKESYAKEAVPKGSPLQVTIKTKRSVLVRVRQDGVLIMERVLPSGARESFKAQDKLELYVARGEAMDISLNGKPLGSPGKGIRNLEITRKGMKVR